MDKVEQGQAEHPEWFVDRDVHAHTMLPFVGRVDPTSGALSFVLYEPLKNPELKDRLTKEVDAAFAKGFPDFETLETMKDVEGFVLETLRLHPTGFMLSRNATEDFVFAGHHVKKGAELLVFTSANHFKKEYFPQPIPSGVWRSLAGIARARCHVRLLSCVSRSNPSRSTLRKWQRMVGATTPPRLWKVGQFC